jgi:hypothetical protein
MRVSSIFGLAAIAVVACGGSTASNVGDGGGVTNDDGGATSGDDGGVTSGDDASASDGSVNHPHDSGGPDASATIDSSIPPDPNDGTPTRQACIAPDGTVLSMSHGRMDGYLVAIVALGGSHACNGDSTHVHLQVKMNGQVYDVAANADTMIAERDVALPDGAWSEGWHSSDSLDYVQLGLHSSDFASVGGTSQMAQKIEQELANANHVSVFCTGYGPTGCHLVHRQSGGRDGAIVIHPTSGTAHVMFFDFTTTSAF